MPEKTRWINQFAHLPAADRPSCKVCSFELRRRSDHGEPITGTLVPARHSVALFETAVSLVAITELVDHTC